MSLPGKLVSLLVAGALVIWAAVGPRIFENKPRTVATGRDPMLYVRASGAVSLLKVEGANLWLQTSLDGADSFEEPVRVNDLDGEVSSHPEASPQLQVKSRSEFYTLWQTRKGTGDGSRLRFARSMNWGESFHKAIDVDTSADAASQSFFTMNVSKKGVIYAAWLDGRDRGKGRPGSSAVYLARSTDKGASFEKPVRVSLDVCPCCRPSIAFAADRMYLTWRSVGDNNVRDIYVASSTDEGKTWGAGKRVAEDNWVLNGCPHSGAALATMGKRLFLTWHTVRDNRNKLYLSYSDDGGETFTHRADVSEHILDPNHPSLADMGDRVGLVFQGRNAAAQTDTWAPLEAWYREFDAQGKLSPLERLGHLEGSAAYPTLAYEAPGRLFVAWTEPHKSGKAIVLSRGRVKRQEVASSAR